MPPIFYELLEVEEPKDEGIYFKNFSRKDENDPERTRGDLPEECNQPWSKIDYPEVAAWLKANEEPVKIAMRAIERPSYYYPLVPIAGSSRPLLLAANFSFSQKFRNLAYYFKVRAMNAIQEQRIQDAWNDLYAAMRLGRLIQSNAGTVIDSLVGQAVIRLAQGACGYLYPKLTRENFAFDSLHQQLSELPPRRSLDRQLDECERFCILDLLQHAHGTTWNGDVNELMRLDDLQARPGLIKRMFIRSLNYNQILLRINEVFDAYIAASQKPDINAKRVACQQVIESLKQSPPPKFSILSSSRTRAIHIANGVLLEMTGNYDRLIVSSSYLEIQTRIFELAFSVAEYRVQHGHYPEKLEELKLPAAQLIDGYSGKQLHYERWNEGFLLCSLGENQQWERYLQTARDKKSKPNLQDEQERAFRLTLLRIPVPGE